MVCGGCFEIHAHVYISLFSPVYLPAMRSELWPVLGGGVAPNLTRRSSFYISTRISFLLFQEQVGAVSDMHAQVDCQRSGCRFPQAAHCEYGPGFLWIQPTRIHFKGGKERS
jgi:hypothetical protein